MVYYIADTHFGDLDVFGKCKRPFNSLDEMENAIAQKWNEKVKDDDVVYVLGDLAKEGVASFLGVFAKLRGRKNLIVGNHDRQLLEAINKTNIFETVKFIDLIDDNGRKVCVCHYPLLDWIGSEKASFLVYGHIHNKTPDNGYIYKLIKDFYKDLPAYNCGVDVCGFEPRTLDELMVLKEDNKNDAHIN